MSLILKNNINLLSGNTLKVYDSTGTYNATTNIMGWGTPNPTRSGITSSTLSIYLPNATTSAVTTTVTSVIQAATSEEFLLASYTLSDLGLSGNTLADGIYKIIYTVISGGVTYINEQYFLSYYNVQCCVFNAFAKFIVNDCECKSDTSDILVQYSMLKAIMFGVAGGNLIDSQKTLTKLQKMCSLNKCC